MKLLAPDVWRVYRRWQAAAWILVTVSTLLLVFTVLDHQYRIDELTSDLDLALSTNAEMLREHGLRMQALEREPRTADCPPRGQPLGGTRVVPSALDVMTPYSLP